MKSKHFLIQELVSEKVYDARGDRAWELLNPDMLKLIDRIKEKFPEGSMTINNWKWGGSRDSSGLRTSDSNWYSPTSQHSLGNAVDCVFSDYDTDEVRWYLIDNTDEFPELRGIELSVGWLHVDVRNRDDVLAFNP